MDRVTFKVNGEECSVGSDVTSDMMLVDYLRTRLELRGTKYMCREGGCGACIVSAITTPGGSPKAVNSCLVAIMSCQNWDITTIEKVGNRKDGYHKIQKTLARKNGTQCGYCSPGWVMAMYSLISSKKDVNMIDIEKSLGSNICRCTGYRPILEAFTKFAKDASDPINIADIEDLHRWKSNQHMCDKSKCDDNAWCMINIEDVINKTKSKINLKDGKMWYSVESVTEIFDILELEGDISYMLVAGNTAKGVYPIEDYPRLLLDVTKVQELKGYKMDQNLIIGAATTLTEMTDIFKEVHSSENYFQYLKQFIDHLDLVAHLPVKNIGTIGGNLMIKNQHNEFPSDLFLLFETVGAYLTILSSGGQRETLTIQQFLTTNMKRKILYNVLLPPLNEEYQLVTFKIMPRAQNAHAIVNSGFLFKLNKENKVLDTRIVYGGLSSTFNRAYQTENLLKEKTLFVNETLQSAIKSLDNELKVEENPPEPMASYKKQLALGLFYKGLLSLCPPNELHPRYQSGAIDLKKMRPVSKARQEYSTNPKLYPLNQPIQKVEALIQCSGEAKYSADLPSYVGEVYAAYVTSTVAIGEIQSIDPSSALNEPGVVAFYTAPDLPGSNTFMPVGTAIFVADEEILCSGKVKYYDQPLGIIVAENQQIAERAAKMVQVTYKNVKKPVLDVKKAKHDPSRTKLLLPIPAINKGFDVAKVIKAEYTIYGQYHFCMETMCCVTRPTEEGLEVHTSTQWIDVVQQMISRALKIQQNKIDVHVRRLGGAFGLKISRATQLAISCSLVTQKLNRPCRFVQSLTSAMRSVGKRLPCTANIEAGVNKKGVIQNLSYDVYEDNGYVNSELVALLGLDAYSNCYDRLRWNYRCYNVNTDNAKNTYCRAPGSLEQIAMAEWIMEQISYELSLDPLEVRFSNLDVLKSIPYRSMVNTVKEKSEYEVRRAAVDKFNQDNRWKKRGLRWALMKWNPLSPAYFDVNLSVFHGDGSVIITHAGIEMGQGINTKAVQICAHFLNIPIEKIQIKANDTTSAPNSFLTGSSITSQNIGRGVERCCKELLRRLAPIRILLLNPTWENLIDKAYKLNIDLQVHEFIGEMVSPIFTAMGVTLAEVEMDVLTGEFQILRVDLLEDVGRSVSPDIDIGQVEGAFIMGLGYWTSEKLVYAESGELLTDRTWNYHVPQARDIPQDFRVYFRDDSYSSDIALGAKVTGEPPICMSVVVPFAIREAITAARKDTGIPTTQWFQIDGPYTLESIAMATATNSDQFKFN
uniref:Aldehyde oxidase n=1 Tax=Glyphodes pyloalis TaxID=1242752 RepID=A0A6M3GV93_GLYPY|nr:aldehyde oxidase [Glyphodes pyloalis]